MQAYYTTKKPQKQDVALPLSPLFFFLSFANEQLPVCDSCDDQGAELAQLCVRLRGATGK